jgi:phenylacetate-CoA ligase
MYTSLCSGLLFPLHERLKGHRSVALRTELEQTQWLDPAALEALQLARLQQFLGSVGASVPYYRRLFERVGFDSRQVSSIRDLEHLPFLTKSLIREHSNELKSERAGRLLRYNTGGSTGEPLVFYMGVDRVTHDVAAKWRATRWWGVDIGDREIVLWGSPIELGAQDRLRALRDRVLRSKLLPAFEMSYPRMNEYLKVIRRFKPRMLFGYASALARLAQHAQAQGIALTQLGVRVAFATGETLYPDQRQVIEKAFGSAVANGYGSRDAGFIAHECPSGSLHLSAEHILVELVDERGQRAAPGEPGEVVVTHMGTAEFPFIRYRTGDMAVLGSRSCPCGRTLPILETVYGRSTDFIRTRSGGAMHALALIYEVRDRAGVQAFKFVQAEDLSIELHLVAGREVTAEVEQDILTRLRRRLGHDASIRISRVESIQPEKSGKHRYVVSRAPAGAPS